MTMIVQGVVNGQVRPIRQGPSGARCGAWLVTVLARVGYAALSASCVVWPSVRRAGLSKAEPGADAGPAAPQAPP